MARQAKNQEGGNREVHLACQVARMASGVSRMPEGRLLDVTVSDNRSRLKIRRARIEHVHGGTIPIPRPAGIPRPGPAGS
jgi:hypothetical protein